MYQHDFPSNIRNRVRVLFSDQRGSTFAYVVFLTSMLILLSGTLTSTMIFSARDAYQQAHRTQAFYLAEAGVTHALYDFKTSGTDLNAVLLGPDETPGTSDDGLLSFGSTLSLGDGYCSIVVTDNDDGDADMYSDTDNIVLVSAVGGLNTTGVDKTVKAYVEVASMSTMAVNPRSVITSSGPIKTLGTLVVDGRDHDLSEVLILNTGVLGVSTEHTYQQSGNSKVGGTAGGADYSPSKPGNAAIIETAADWSAEGGFPNTPDKVVGLPEGTLKAIAQSGVNGSQYVTDPSLLAMPLSGVTYVELPSGGTWQSIHLYNSSGILVVHNTSTDAIVKNINTGSLSGLLIADDILHVHTTILGAVYNLTSAPSSGNCIGNGSGDVLYSSEAITTALAQIGNDTAVSVKSWFY